MKTIQSMPVVTGAQMTAVDTAMAEVCGLDLMQVMETAGRAIAIQARLLASTRRFDGPIALLCGGGGNGGDAFVCGRYLAGWGFDVEFWLVRSISEMRGLAGHQLQVCQKLGLSIREPSEAIGQEIERAVAIVDGLFGFGLNAPPRGRAVELIAAANASSAPTLAIDIPSGIDATSGQALGNAIDATLTVTLGLPKRGLFQEDGRVCAGRVVVADIGIPAAAFRAAGIPLTNAFQEFEFIGVPEGTG